MLWGMLLEAPHVLKEPWELRILVITSLHD